MNPVPSQQKKFKIGRTAIDNISFEETLNQISEAAKAKGPSFVVTPNVDHIVLLEKDNDFKEAYDKASLVLADGMPIIWAAKLLKQPLKEKISGADLMPILCEKAEKENLSIFILGAPPGVADLAVRVLIKRHPNLVVKGTYSPPMGFEKSPGESDKIMDLLNKKGADIIFIGFGSPKQEIWISKNIDRLNRGVMLGVGASIEFLAGTQKRAPRLMQQMGLEWLYRLVHEPRRLYKRYLRDLKFIVILWREIFGR